MPALVTAWGRRLAYLGQAVVLESDAGSEQGILQGVTASGQLRLQAADGREWVAGDEFRGMRAVDYDPG
jgi:biotin-(acetyl-CoA carboxylase) ligase